MSVGSAIVDPGDKSKSLEQALAEADLQVYQQKRNRAPGLTAGRFWGRGQDV